MTRCWLQTLGGCGSLVLVLLCFACSLTESRYSKIQIQI